jgi:Uma2 family endonuclease
MQTQARLTGGASLRTPMRYDDYVTLGETKHHEYYDGMCVVNPPNKRHVLATKRITRLLDDHCPSDLTVYPEWGWRTTVGDFEPDVMVAATDAPSGDQLDSPPLLIVEISSPTTRDVDWGRKKDLYAAAGANWYWIVDLERLEMVVFENVGEAFIEVQRIIEADSVIVGPFQIVVDVADLRRGG